jgi:hypothetical protein
VSWTRADVVRRWAGEVRAAVGRARSASESSAGAPAQPLKLTAHMVADPCPARACAPSAQEFPGESARLAARRVALAGLAFHRGTPHERVRAALHSGERLDGSLVDWLGGLTPSATVAVEAAALGWAVDAVALGAGLDEPVWSTDGLRWRDRAASLELRASFDARRGAPGRHRLLVLRPRPGPRDDEAARFVALVYALACGEVPERVTFGYRGPLTHRAFATGPEDLAAAVADVGRIEPSLRGGDAPTVAGPWCGRCPRLEGCPEGQVAMSERRTAWEAVLPARPAGGPAQSAVESPAADLSSATGVEPTM